MQKKKMPKKKKWHIKIGDNVKVISGSCKNIIGEVLKINPNNGSLIIKGVNFKSKHIQPTTQTRSGQVKKIEAPIHHSNVKLNLTDIL
jgi:large subunit ribosomal protein L24